MIARGGLTSDEDVRDHRLFRRGLELAPPAQPADQAPGARRSSCSRRSCCRRSSCRSSPSSSSSRLVGRPASADGPGDADPGRPAALDPRRQRLFFPGATDTSSRSARWRSRREGLTFGLDLGRSRARRVPGVGRRSCSRRWRTTCSRRSSPAARATGSRSSSCRRSRWSRGCRAAPARSSRRSRRAACRSKGSFVAPDAGARAARSGRSCSARSSTSASGRSRSRRAGSARDPAGPPTASSPTRRSIAGCGCSSWPVRSSSCFALGVIGR